MITNTFFLYFIYFFIYIYILFLRTQMIKDESHEGRKAERTQGRKDANNEA